MTGVITLEALNAAEIRRDSSAIMRRLAGLEPSRSKDCAGSDFSLIQHCLRET